METTASCAVSTHSIRSGSYNRFCYMRFVDRARSYLLPVNRVSVRHTGADSHCMEKHADYYQQRHDEITDAVVRAVGDRQGEVGLDSALPDVNGVLLPDIVFRDPVRKVPHIDDVTTAFENGLAAPDRGRQLKIERLDTIKT